MKQTLLVWVTVCATWAMIAQTEKEERLNQSPPLITAINAPRLLNECLNLKRWEARLKGFREMNSWWITYMTDDSEWIEQVYGESLPKMFIERVLDLQILESEEKARIAFEKERETPPEIGWHAGTPTVGEEMLWSGGHYVIFRVDNAIVRIATPVQVDPNDIYGKPEVWERVRPYAQRLCERLKQGQGGVQRGQEVRQLALHLEPADDPIIVGKGEEKHLTFSVKGLDEKDIVLLGESKGPFHYVSLPKIPEVQWGFRASESVDLLLRAPNETGEWTVEIPASSIMTNVVTVLRRKVVAR